MQAVVFFVIAVSIIEKLDAIVIDLLVIDMASSHVTL